MTTVFLEVLFVLLQLDVGEQGWCVIEATGRAVSRLWKTELREKSELNKKKNGDVEWTEGVESEPWKQGFTEGRISVERAGGLFEG